MGQPPQEQTWNWHVQNTDIVQGYPAFGAKYSGPNSLPNDGQIRETVSLDLMAGIRLWDGAEAHIDGLMWQGFGVGQTLGVEGFPNGEAFRLGTDVPNVNIPRLFIRQTIGLGGEQEDVPDDLFTLAGKQDVSRLTLTMGKMSAKDIFDNNAYANDPRTQFMNWALMGNEAWDYPADALGYITGVRGRIKPAGVDATLRFFPDAACLQWDGDGFSCSRGLGHGDGVRTALCDWQSSGRSPVAGLSQSRPHGQLSGGFPFRARTSPRREITVTNTASG